MCDMICSDMLSSLVVVGEVVTVFNRLILSSVAFKRLLLMLMLLTKFDKTLLGTVLLE